MSIISTLPPVARRQSTLRQSGKSNSFPPHAGGTTSGQAAEPTDPRVFPSRTMSSAANSGNTGSTHYIAVDQSRSSPNGVSWSFIRTALCTVVGLTFAFYYTGNFLFSLASATILRTIGLSAVMVPALFDKNEFRLKLRRRRTFALLCLLSVISVIIAWVIWHRNIPRWPQVLITISDVFLAVAGAQLAMSTAHETQTMHQNSILMDEHSVDVEAQHPSLSRAGSQSQN